MVAELDDKMLSLNDAIQACLLNTGDNTSGKEKLEEIAENVIGNKRAQNSVHFADVK